jgi:septal ring factor EnvC (AmiA/AmiB activator)
MAEEARPRLHAVPNPPQHPVRKPDRGPASTRTAFWVLLFGVVICALIAAYQTQQVDSLVGQVAALEAELTDSRAEVAAYQGQIGEIREAVTDLRGQLGALDALVQSDPRGDTTTP